MRFLTDSRTRNQGLKPLPTSVQAARLKSCPDTSLLPGRGESGFVLLAVIFLTLVMLITLAIAAPKMAASIQRDKDLETIHRGEQYKRAIQLYYRQFGRYPTSVDQLVQTNQIRFLRKRYTDPETGKDDWKPVIYGRAHVRPLGFFGQPLAAAAGGAIAVAAMGNASMGMYAPDAGTNVTKDANGVPVAADSSSAASTSSSGGSGPGGTMAPSSGTFSMGGQPGAGGSSGFGSGPSFGGSSFGSGQAGSPMGGAMGGTNPGMGAPGTPGMPGMGNQGATSFGGSQGPMVGVTLPLNKPSVIVYKKQDRYNKWEFNYDPVEDQMKAAASMFGGGSGQGGVPGGTMPGAGGMGGPGTAPMGGAGGTGIGNSGQSDPFGFGQSGAAGSSPQPAPQPQPAPNPQ